MKAPWRAELDRALAAAGHDAGARYLQLATVTAERAPANRTVVFRGFDADGGLLIATDRRSAKVADIARRPAVELCWWLATTRQQFRLAGRAALVADAAAVRGIWQQLAPPVRRPFFGPAPGSGLASAKPRAVSETGIEPPDAFAVLAVAIERVDRVDLGTTPHRRLLYRRTGAGWSVDAVVA